MSLKSWFKKAANAVENVVDKAGDVVSDVVETAGNLVGDNLKAAGNWAGDHLGSPGTLIKEGCKWLGDAVASGAALAASGVKSGCSLIGHSLGGMILIAVGTVTGDGDVIKAGFLDIVYSVSGSALIFMGGVLHALNTTLWGVGTRALREDERKLLKNVFRKSIAYFNVRIATGRGGLFRMFFDQTANDPRPFTLGNIIYFFNQPIESDTLVHECTHVWQYQHNGPGYAARSRWTELEKGDTRTYNWRREIRSGRDHWPEMNVEAQAELVEDVWDYGDVIVLGSTPANIVAEHNGVFFDDLQKVNERRFEFRSGPKDGSVTDHTPLANEAMKIIRDARSVRPSRSIN